MKSHVCFVFLSLYTTIIFAEPVMMDTPPEGIEALFLMPSATFKIEQWQPGIFNQTHLYDLYPVSSSLEPAKAITIAPLETETSVLPEPTPLPLLPLTLGLAEEPPTLIAEGDVLTPTDDHTPTNEMEGLTFTGSLTSTGVMDDSAPLSLSLASGFSDLIPESLGQVVTLSELSSYSHLHWLLELYVKKHPEKAEQFNPEGQILLVNLRLIKALDQAISEARSSLPEGELIKVMRRMIAMLHINLFYFVENSELLNTLLMEYFTNAAFRNGVMVNLDTFISALIDQKSLGNTDADSLQHEIMNLFAEHYYGQFVQELLSANLANLAIFHVLAMSTKVQGYLLQNQLIEGAVVQRRSNYARLLSCIRRWSYFDHMNRQLAETFFDQLLQMLRRNLGLYVALGGCQCRPARNDVLLYYLNDALEPDNPVHVEATARILNQPEIFQTLSVFALYVWRHLNKNQVTPYLQAVLQQPVPVLSGRNAFTQAASWAFQGLHVIEAQQSVDVDSVVETGVNKLAENQGVVTLLTMHLQLLVQNFAPGEFSGASEENIVKLIRAFLARFVKDNLADKDKTQDKLFQQ